MSRGIDVLVVDDRAVDADMTILAVRLAAPQARVLRLKGGGEALEYLFAVGQFSGRSPSLPTLVLLDMDMPVISGLCVLDVIRAHPLTHRVPIVMLGSNGASRAHRRHDSFAADAYVVRPVDFERYCALIEAILNRWSPETLCAAARSKRRNGHRSMRASTAALRFQAQEPV